MIGTSLTHYRITAKLGQGGMGAVYQATTAALDVLRGNFHARSERVSQKR